MTIDARIAELGITLPEPAKPVASYVSYVRSGNQVTISGQLSNDANGGIKGTVGVDVTPAVAETINRGDIHIVEPDLDAYVRSAVQSGRLRAATAPDRRLGHHRGQGVGTGGQAVQSARRGSRCQPGRTRRGPVVPVAANISALRHTSSDRQFTTDPF